MQSLYFNKLRLAVGIYCREPLSFSASRPVLAAFLRKNVARYPPLVVFISTHPHGGTVGFVSIDIHPEIFRNKNLSPSTLRPLCLITVSFSVAICSQGYLLVLTDIFGKDLFNRILALIILMSLLSHTAFLSMCGSIRLVDNYVPEVPIFKDCLQRR